MNEWMGNCLVGGLQWSSVWLFFWHIFASDSTLLKLKIVGMASSLRSSLRGLKAGPSKLLTARFCLKLPGVKWSAQTREYLVGSNDSLLSFMSHSFRSFRLSGNLNVLTLDLEFFTQFIAAQNNIIFAKEDTEFYKICIPHFSSTPTVTSQLLFPMNFPTIDPTAPRP